MSRSPFADTYKTLDGGTAECHYCGEAADTWDHWPPLCAARSGDPRARLRIRCCFECNNLLGAQDDATLQDRKRRAKERLRAKYKRQLAMPDWTADELDEVGDELRSMILSAMALKRVIRRRIK